MTEPTLANWNGDVMPLEDVKVPVLDRSFLFGDAIYEALRVYHGHMFHPDEHFARLQRSLDKLQISVDVSRVRQRTDDLLNRSALRDAFIYIHITRGVAPRSHAFPVPRVVPNELIYVAPFEDPYVELRQTGCEVIIIEDIRWKRCDMKSANLLANCLGAEQASKQNCIEAIYENEAGYLTEGTHTSLFAVKDGAILTAPLEENILPGITRKLLLKLAVATDVPVQDGLIKRSDLSEIDELFLAGTTTELMPITIAAGQTIGTGQVGPVAKKLYSAYQNCIDALKTN